MRKKHLLFFLFNCFCFYAQVGIGTTSPTADLDVNGTLRIRTTSTNLNESAAKDSILVSDNLGNITRISSKKIIESHLKSFVKGNFPTTTNVSMTLSSNKALIPFSLTEFDTNSEFNTSSSVFTSKQNGVFEIYIQIKASSASVATNFGVQILKNGNVISQNSFANVGISVLGIGIVNVTPPTRTVQTLTQLNIGDTIQFNVTSTLGTVTLLGTSEDCYFTIKQVR